MRNQWGTTAYVRKATGEVVDITAYVHSVSKQSTVTAAVGRQTELDTRGQPGRLEIVLNNTTGIFTPGRTGASVQLTLGMPIWFVDTIGYKTFEVFNGFIELPETAENLEGVDNFISLTAVDRKQLLDNGRTIISTLAAHIMGTPTLRHYYPLVETAAPFTDAVGKGAPFVVELSRSSVVDTDTARPGITYGGGVQARGDDVQGVKFEPTMTSEGGFGFDIVAQGWQLVADFQSGVQSADRPRMTASDPLTLIVWLALGSTNDSQGIMSVELRDETLNAQIALVDVSRIMNHSTFGADAGLLAGQVIDVLGGTLDGVAMSTEKFLPSGNVMVPVGIRLTFTSITLWLADQEFTAASVTGSPSGPQQVFGNVYLGRLLGSVAHFQIHVGDFTHDDFLAQHRVGIDGMAYDRTDERIARILRYVSPTDPIPAQLDQGVTFMQRASLAGKRPGQVIDEAVDTERGRFYVDGGGISRFHSRIRTHYNL